MPWFSSSDLTIRAMKATRLGERGIEFKGREEQ